MQHALRAFTARNKKALQKAAETYRNNDRFSTYDAINDVGVGEAVTSFLQKKGVPGIVERTLIRPPSSQLGPITDAERRAVMKASEMAGKYDTAVDKKSAYEILKARAEKAAKDAADLEEKEEDMYVAVREYASGRRYSGTRVGRSSSRSSRSTKTSGDIGSKLGKMVMKELTGTTGRRLVRGILGSLFKGR